MKYQASAKETFDEIAFRLYGDEKYASVLLEANPEHTSKIFMRGGEILRAPDIEKAEDASGLPPWKRRE